MLVTLTSAMVDVLDQEIMAIDNEQCWHGKPARARSKLGSKIFDCRAMRPMPFIIVSSPGSPVPELIPSQF